MFAPPSDGDAWSIAAPRTLHRPRGRLFAAFVAASSHADPDS